MVECGICLEDYQEGDLELHREMCLVRLVFRCSLCDEDYVNKEGLWNHLDLHEIADESKELHYQEIKAKYKLHQCVLCNNQRAYSESPYWKHVHDVHDGFFLRCSDCGENFRSEQLKNDHAFSHSKSRAQMEEEPVPFKFENMTFDADHLKLSREDQSCNAHEGLKNRLSEHLRVDFESESDLGGKTTRRSGPEILVSSSDSCSSSDFVEGTDSGTDTSTAKVDVADKSVQSLVEDPSSKSSDYKCINCDKECISAKSLRHHITQIHKPTKCSICDITFAGTARARCHKVMKHTKSKYECAHCSKKFYFINHYEQHANACDPVQRDVSNHKKSEEVILKKKKVPKVAAKNPPSEESCSKCAHCGIEESSAATLARHILMHHDPVACDFCGITFSNLPQAQRHMELMHKESPHKCPHCSMQCFASKRLQCHISKCEKEKVPCGFCGKMFKDEIAVTVHMSILCDAYIKSKEQKQKADETDSSKKCYHCEEDFSSQGYLNHHLKICHQLTKCDICGITVIGITSIRHHKIKSHHESNHQCVNCGEKFHHINEFKAHRFECDDLRDSPVIDNEPPMVSIATLNGTSQPLVENPSNQLYSCNICGIALHTYSKINYHMLIKHTEGKLQCPHCSRKFHFNRRLDEHLASCAKLKYACELCGQKFHVLSGVMAHKEQVHHDITPLKNANIDGPECTEEKMPYSGEKNNAAQEMTSSLICRIPFVSTAELMQHKMCFIMQPQYECVKCSNKYHSLEDFKRHSNGCNPVQSDSSIYKGAGELIPKERSDPKVTPENPSSESSRTKCSYCGIEVSSAVALARHILVHHDTGSCTKCSYCGMEESNAVTLARHILMHHDPVACDFCGMTLTSLAQAQHHKKTMHKESTSKCPHCSRQFDGQYKASLQKHVSKCRTWKVPCECCGKMFQNATRVTEHKRKSCRAYKRGEEQGQKTAEASKTRCYYCNEELSSPGYLNHHLKVCHELTKCDICGITVIGLPTKKKHKFKNHLEPKHECPACGEKFHFRIDLHAHYSACEHKRYLCKLCGSTFQDLAAFNRHYKKSHPDEKSIKIGEFIRAQKQGPSKALQTEITAEETAILAPDDQLQSTVKPTSKADASNSRPNEHSLANLSDDDLMESQGIDMEFPVVSVAPFNGTSEEQVISEKTSQPRVGNLSNHPYSCNICGITLARPSQVTYHKLHCTNHGKDHDDSQFGAKENSLLQDVKGTRNYSTTATQDENIDLELEIKVEKTVLLEQEYQDPNEDPGRSFFTTLNPYAESEDADDLEKGIKVKEECLEDEEKIETDQQTSTESAECHEVPIDRNESRVRHEVMDVYSKEAKNKSHPQRRKLPSDFTERRSSKRIRVKTEKLNC